MVAIVTMLNRIVVVNRLDYPPAGWVIRIDSRLPLSRRNRRLRRPRSPRHSGNVRARNAKRGRIAGMERLPEKSIGHCLAIRDCGLADYRQILQLQQELHDERREGKTPDTVLIVEHPPVITLGARTTANSLLVSREELYKRHIDLVEVRRGGGVTAHNPGQLVFYPMMHLRELGLGVSDYIRKLEAIGTELLEQLGVQSMRQKGFPGLWVTECGSTDTTDGKQRTTTHERRETKKIALIGVQVSKGVTYHGMAINIQNDLSIFELIVPCGLEGVEMTSVLKETGKRNAMDEVKQRLAYILTKGFG